MRKGLVALAVVVILVGAAIAAVPVLERHAAAEIKRQIELAGAATVDEVSVGLFDRKIKLLNLRSSADAEVSVGRWEASGLAWPLSELLSGRAPLAGWRWGDPLQARRIELEAVSVVDRAADSSASMDFLGIDDLSLARYDAAYDGAFPFAALTARALAALNMRRLEQRNLRVTVPGSSDTLALGSVVVEGYDRGFMASIVLAGLGGGPKDAPPSFSIADVTLGGLDLRRVFTAMASANWYPGGPTGRIHLDKASATGFAGELLKRYGVTLAGASIETARESDKVSRSRMRIEGFALAPPLRGLEGMSLRLALQSMGLKEIKADFDCAGTEDRGRGELVLDRCAVIGPGLGEVDLTARIVNADPVFWSAIDEADTMMLLDSSAALGSARLVVTDRSLLERALRAVATFSSQPVAGVRASWARDVRRYQPAGVLISQAMTQLLETIARFVELGGTITIDAKPEPPLGFDRIESLASPGADLVSLLGLSATLSK
ncbi:MAG: hypothetical protein JO021_07215 [Alphaproteobacteria bacterium]|nr:hypothetical protein [Alphaproteobacteria bacterium]